MEYLRTTGSGSLLVAETEKSPQDNGQIERRAWLGAVEHGRREKSDGG
jgi:hypothetical protein